MILMFVTEMLTKVIKGGGKGTSAEVPAITSSSPGHTGFNMVSSVWSPESFSPVPVERGGIVGCGGIVGVSERSGYLDYQKKKRLSKACRREGKKNKQISNLSTHTHIKSILLIY